MKRKQFGWQLPPEIESRLGASTYGHQRAIFEKGHLLLVLHAPPGPDDNVRDAQVFLRKPDGSFLWNGKEGGDRKLRQLLESYNVLFEKLNSLYDAAHNASALFEIMEQLAPINRASTNLHSALQAARELVREDPFILSMRDEAYEISRNCELLLGDAKLSLDFRIAKHAEAQSVKAEELSSAQHKLNIMAAMTFPIMAIATVFGMNLTSGFENQPEVFFWMVIALGIMVGLVTLSWVTHKKPKDPDVPRIPTSPPPP